MYCKWKTNLLSHSDYQTFSQLFMVSVFHHVSDTYNIRPGLRYTPKSLPLGKFRMLLAISGRFILLVRTLALSHKIIFNSSYTEENNYFLLYKLIQDLPYVTLYPTFNLKKPITVFGLISAC